MHGGGGGGGGGGGCLKFCHAAASGAPVAKCLE